MLEEAVHRRLFRVAGQDCQEASLAIWPHTHGAHRTDGAGLVATTFPNGTETHWSKCGIKGIMDASQLLYGGGGYL